MKIRKLKIRPKLNLVTSKTTKTKTCGLILAALAFFYLITFGIYYISKEKEDSGGISTSSVTTPSGLRKSAAADASGNTYKAVSGPRKSKSYKRWASDNFKEAQADEEEFEAVNRAAEEKDQEKKLEGLKKKEKQREAFKRQKEELDYEELDSSQFDYPILPADADSKFVGIANVGNTCFANSIFQVLYHTPSFRSAIQNYITDNAGKSVQSKGHTQMLGLYRIFQALSGAQNKFVSLTLRQIRDALPVGLRTKRSEDSGQLLNFYADIPGLDWSHLELHEVSTTKITYKGVPSPVSSVVNIGISSLVLDFPKHDKSNDVTMLELLTHHYSPQSIEPFLCQNESAKTKQLQLSGERFPEAFTIQLMRFYTGPKGAGCKNNSKVTVAEIIDLQNYSIIPDQGAKPYRLAGFIKHTASGLDSSGAHYYAIVRGPNDTWIELNDSGVSEITHARMTKEAKDGYIFVYHKIQI